MRRRRVRDAGFTLVELMIVVAIVGVLAVIAGTAYRKYGARARAAEVYAMFGEIRAKEEAFRAEFSYFCTTAATVNPPTLAGCTGGDENTFYPALLSSNEPKAKAWRAGAPVGWKDLLGINPAKDQLYCGYAVVAGGAADFAAAGARGAAMFSTAPTGVWWYASAACDNDGQNAVNVTFTTAQNTTQVSVINEGR
jgi:prepilin-type N-terminal cleavage/methylation domain-containing protein